jgi:hypothetical protein
MCCVYGILSIIVIVIIMTIKKKGYNSTIPTFPRHSMERGVCGQTIKMPWPSGLFILALCITTSSTRYYALIQEDLVRHHAHAEGKVKQRKTRLLVSLSVYPRSPVLLG